MARGLLDWSEVSGRKEDRNTALLMVRQAWQRFYGEQGWQLTDHMWLRYGAGETLIPDGVMPSPAEVLIACSLRLDNKELTQMAMRALNVGKTEIMLGPFWYASRIGVIRQYQTIKISASLSGGASRTSNVN